jgi:putative DNA primase/helicase
MTAVNGSTTLPDSTNASAAAWYAQNLGWKVFPVHSIRGGHCSCKELNCKDAGKHPRTQHGVHDASSDTTTIERWWIQWPDANIGLATGSPSGVDVLDVDPRSFGDETLWDLERKHGDLPQTVTSLTGGGGAHLYFKHVPGLKNLNGAIGEGLDFKTTGGYVVLPPSQHVSGRPYMWEGASRPNEVPVVDPPGWLFEIARSATTSTTASGVPKVIQPRIPDGQRHKVLTSLAGTLRRRGLDGDEIFASLQAVNVRRGDPALPETKVRQIANGISRYEPAAPLEMGNGSTLEVQPYSLDLLQGFPPEDVGNGHRLIAMHGTNLRYCYAFKKWLVWDQTRWNIDEGEHIQILTHEAMEEFALQAARANNESLMKFAAICRRSARIANAIGEARPYLEIRSQLLDTNPDLLNFRNGTLDLKTGQLREHRREDYITKMVHYDYRPEAQCPTFMGFLRRITANHPGLVPYLQKAFGYSLTGHTIEKAVFFLHGRGNNGKSTLLSTFRNLLDEYAVLLQVDSLMVRQENNNSQADIADLRGARFVMTSETEEGQRLAEGKLKRITQGMGNIKATRKYENPIEFPETHKLWIDANHLPIVRGTDNAIWNRLHPVPFDVTILPAEQDKELPAKLLAEAEGILAWAVAGGRRRYQDGLGKPTDVEKAGGAWRAESDQIGRFIEAYCVTVKDAWCPGRKLYGAYKKWAEEAGERVERETDFSKRIVDQGFTRKHRETGTVYEGLGLMAPADT